MLDMGEYEAPIALAPFSAARPGAEPLPLLPQLQAQLRSHSASMPTAAERWARAGWGARGRAGPAARC